MTSSRADAAGSRALRVVLLRAGFLVTIALAAFAWSPRLAAQSETGTGIDGAPSALEAPAAEEEPAAEDAPASADPQALEPPEPEESAGQSGAAGETPDDARSGDGEGTASGDEIEVNILEAPDADAVGVLREGEGGFGADMWRGTSRDLAFTLIELMPEGAPSFAMQEIARRLLLSVAVPPAETDDGAAEAADVTSAGETASAKTAVGPETKGAPPERLIELRLGKLAAMGDVQAFDRLLDATPRTERYPRLVKARTNHRLLAGNYKAACAEAAAMIARSNDPYWQKTMVFCRILAGSSSEAELGLGLLREMGIDDSRFFTLARWLMRGDDAASGEAGGPAIENPAPLHFAMARAADLPVSEAILDRARPAVLASIAGYPAAPDAVRLAAAERAALAGAMPVDRLRNTYGTVEFDAEARANPLSMAEEETGARARALLYQAASNADTVPAAQAEATALAFSLSEGPAVFALMARVFRPVIEGLPPRSDLIWFADGAIRALIVAGAPERTRPWQRLLNANAMSSEEARAVRARLLPYIALSDPAADAAPALEKIEAWRDTIEDERSAPKVALLLSLLEALGKPVPEAAWNDLPVSSAKAPAALPDVALWRRLGHAAANGRKAETALAALLVLGSGGPAKADSIVLARVVSALAEAGLADEARLIALEAVLGAGL